MRDDFTKFKNLLWRFLDHFVIDVGAFGCLTVAILSGTPRALNVPHGHWSVVGGDEGLAISALRDRIDVELMDLRECILELDGAALLLQATIIDAT